MWIPALLLALCTNAFAAPKVERVAEAQRLYEEMQRLAQRTAWTGVERQYDKLHDLKNVPYPPYAHVLGAKAAQARGDILEALERANRAVKSADGDMATLQEASQFLTEFDILHGPVQVEVPAAMSTTPALVAEGSTFDPNVRAALGHANDALATQRAFKGYLPLGSYRIGSTRFDVLPDGKTNMVIATPGGPEPTSSSAPPPVATSSRMVMVAVRGEGWQADAWSGLQQSVTEALKQVDGVLLVDAFWPDQSWLIIDVDPVALQQAKLTVDQLRDVLKEDWVVSETPELIQFVMAPPHDLASRAVSNRMVGDVPLNTVATARTADSGPFTMPADTTPLANYRFEVKVQGTSDAKLTEAIAQIEAAAPLGLKVEAPVAQ